VFILLFRWCDLSVLFDSMGISVPGVRKYSHVGFKVFTAMTMKNGVFWDVTPCGSCEN
jgi:hypothetical protein